MATNLDIDGLFARVAVVETNGGTYKGRTVAAKLGEILSVRDYITTAIDGTTSNQTGIVAAVNAAIAAKASLYWPAGTYVSTANISNFHTIKHYGAGVVKRGSVTYTIEPHGKASTTNTLFVSSTGVADNDGLTSDRPFSTIQLAFDALINAGDYLCGKWQVQLAAGTYTQSATIDSVGFRNRLVVSGPDVSGGVPTALIDGVGISTTNLAGLTLSGGVFAQVKDIKFTNWTGASGVGSGGANVGLILVDRSNVWVDNCDFTSCDTGVSATNSRIYQGRGRVTDCDIGSTAFASSQCSFGYGGATTYTNAAVGCNIRDSSSGVVDAGVFVNCNIGVRSQYGSVVRISNCTFTNSTTSDVYGYAGGSVFFGDGNTYTAGKRFRGQDALDLANSSQIYFDGDAGATGRFNFGGALTPNYKFHFREASQNAFASNTALMCIESPSPQIALNGSATGVFGLQCAVPSVTQAASVLYSHVDGIWRIRSNNTDAYQLHATSIRPATDNVASLGLSALRFTVVYAATGTINTSDERSKQDIKPIDEACLTAWSKVDYMQYKFIDAVELKGVDARWHFGVIAQRVKDAFESEGLDAFEYGLLCYDEWDEQPEVTDVDGNITQGYVPAGNRYGIRYEEALALEAALLRNTTKQLRAEIELLKAR